MMEISKISKSLSLGLSIGGHTSEDNINWSSGRIPYWQPFPGNS